jgi:hypothetical protein
LAPAISTPEDQPDPRRRSVAERHRRPAIAHRAPATAVPIRTVVAADRASPGSPSAAPAAGSSFDHVPQKLGKGAPWKPTAAHNGTSRGSKAVAGHAQSRPLR